MSAARVVLTLGCTGLLCGWLWLLFAWVDDKQRRHRQRTITALAALRRRHDAEILEIWLAMFGKPAGEYAPEVAWAPAEVAQPTVFACEGCDDDGFACLRCEHPDPITEPIDMSPATVPSGMPLAVQSALLAEDRTWLDEQHAIALAAIRQIGREAAA